MRELIRLGLVGSSFITDWMLEAVRQTGNVKAAALYSREKAHGADYAQANGIPAVFDDYDEMLGFDGIDAVYLASPNYAHYDQAMAALEAGKHVLCEKPLALNRAQGEAMLAFARRKGLVCMEAIRPVHDPFLEVIRENLPRIGRVRRATFEFCQYSSRYEKYKAGEHVNIFDASLGNAALLDLGVYCLHTCVALFGMPEKIFSGASTLDNGTEVAGTTLLDYGFMQAAVSYSKVTASAFPSLIQGEAGTLAFDTLNGPSYVHLYHLDKSREELPYAPEKNNMVYELADFARCVGGEGSMEPYAAQSMTVLGIMDEIRRQEHIDFGPLEAL